MAIFHLHAQVIKRSEGRSSVAAAAYRLGVALEDPRTGLRHDFSRKGGVSGSLTLAPDNAPAWASDPAQLWANVETIEKRKDAQLCREFDIALPRELTPQQCATLARAFVQKEFVDRGMCATIAFHHIGGDNPHFHLMTTMRDIDQDGFKNKNRDWNDKQYLDHWRAEWARYANHALTLANSPARIDHRSLKAQGIDREPTQHQGPKAFAMQARGVVVDRFRRVMVDLVTMLKARRGARQGLSPSPPITTPPRKGWGMGRGR